MDIFSYAESIDWGADYYDMHTGYVYAIQEAKREAGNKTPTSIKVYNGSTCIGVVNKN